MQTHYLLLPHQAAQCSSSGDVSEVLQLDTSAFPALLPGRDVLNVQYNCIVPASTRAGEAQDTGTAVGLYFQCILILLVGVVIFA